MGGHENWIRGEDGEEESEAVLAKIVSIRS